MPKSGIKKKAGVNWLTACSNHLNSEFYVWDYILIAALFILCYFSFVQGDIMLTGNRGFMMHTNLLDFYDACQEWTKDNGANYLPSTFLLFAVWNLPLRLFGRVPATVNTNAIINNLWYKLLPCLLFFASAWLLYKICRVIGMEYRKAKLSAFAFLLCPIAFFSQLIFSQYDIFTVFFCLLGVYFYFQKKEYRFILFFGIAITFKYQALIYFLVFLLLREKRVFRIIRNVVLAALPFAIELVIYLPSANFRRSVLGFSALSYLETGINVGGLEMINPLLAVLLGILVAAYIAKPDPESPLLFKWCMFLSNGVSFAFFGLAVFHPQWLMITVPFLILSIMTNRHAKFLLLLQNIQILVLYLLTVNTWPNNADQQMFLYAPLKSLVKGAWAVQMKDIYVYNNMSYLFTIFWIILLTYFVLSHPKFSQPDLQVVERDTGINIRIPFLVGVAAWTIPAYICLFIAGQGKFLMSGVEVDEVEDMTSIAVSSDNQIVQRFYNTADEIYDLQLYFSNYGRENQSEVDIALQDDATGKIIYTNTIDAAGIDGNTIWIPILEKSVDVEKEKYYNIIISSDAGSDDCVALYDRPVEALTTAEPLEVNGQSMGESLALKIYGKK